MPSTPVSPGSARSAAEWNEDIRALLARTGGWLYGETRIEYERLITGWTAAEKAEIVEAA